MMEPIQQLQRWQEQLQTAPSGAVGDLLVCDRLIKHGMQTLERIVALERDLAATLAERDDFKFSYLSVIQERKKAEAEAATLRKAFERECAEGDKLCDALGVSRTEGGSLNVPRLVSRAAALKADAERYRWLRTHYGLHTLREAQKNLLVLLKNKGLGYRGTGMALDVSIDAAIDAARGGAHD